MKCIKHKKSIKIVQIGVLTKRLEVFFSGTGIFSKISGEGVQYSLFEETKFL